MGGRRTLSAVTLVVLTALLVTGLVVGWRSFTAPIGDEVAAEPSETCATQVARGDVVRTRDVTVSVFNAGNRAGLADQTRSQLEARGFIAGEIGNAPEEFAVQLVRVLAPRKDDPGAQLVAAQFGPNTLIQVTDADLGPGVDVVIGEEFEGLAKDAPRRVRAGTDAPIC